VSVSFRLPEEGPGGTFANASRSDIETTKADGKASVWGMQWNRTEGSFEIRITAVKGQARAGTVCAVYLSKVTSTTAESGTTAPFKLARNHKWLWIAAGVAGAAGVVVAAAALRGKATPLGPTVTPTLIGNPSIVLGQP